MSEAFSAASRSWNRVGRSSKGRESIGADRGVCRGNSLRDALRRSTRDAHASTEAAFADFDLNRVDGLGRALRAHSVALSALIPSVVSRPHHHEVCVSLLNLANGGLRALDIAIPVSERSISDLHPLGVAYVVLGSRLGARVVRQGLTSNASGSLAAAHEYFLHEAPIALWRPLLEELQHVRAEEECGQIVAAALRAFAEFECAALEARQRV